MERLDRALWRQGARAPRFFREDVQHQAGFVCGDCAGQMRAATLPRRVNLTDVLRNRDCAERVRHRPSRISLTHTVPYRPRRKHLLHVLRAFITCNGFDFGAFVANHHLLRPSRADEDQPADIIAASRFVATKRSIST